MHPLIQAYELGYHSGINGEDPRLCPFPNMTPEWRAWHEAHQHGLNFRPEALRGAVWLTNERTQREPTSRP